MFRFLFLLFIIVPIIEIMVLMRVGAWIGPWPTVAIVIVTAWLGAKNVKLQGLATLNSVQTKMAQGQMPSQEIVEGLMLVIAGVLLVTPGFVTDIFGLSLLLPIVRKAIVNKVQQHLMVNVAQGSSFQNQANDQHFAQHDVFGEKKVSNIEPHHQGETFDGEFERKD